MQKIFIECLFSFFLAAISMDEKDLNKPKIFYTLAQRSLFRSKKRESKYMSIVNYIEKLIC